MNLTRRQPRSSPANARGVTLIELMVALVLGLIVSGAALALFSTNKQTYIASESLARIQEAERTAFELMARDVREGGGNACEKGLDVANIVNPVAGSVPWYADFGGGVRGYGGATAFAGAPFGTGMQNRVSGTDAIELKSTVSSGIVILNQPGGPSADIKLNTVANGFADGDIVMACNFDHAAVFQIEQVNGGGVNVVHNTGNSQNPGNCSKGLGFPAVCTTNGTYYDYGSNPPGMLAKLRATRWYIGYNSRTTGMGQPSRSLYQSSVVNTAGTLTIINNEITQGVRDMQLSYLLLGANTYVDAASPTITAADWLSDKVVAVKIDLTLEGDDRIATSGAALQRHLEHTVAIRNRAP